MKTIYLYFYKNIDRLHMEQLEWEKRVGISILQHPKIIEKLFRHDGTRFFVEQYVIFGSPLYFKFLEIKSKETREEWGREAIHHSRGIKKT